MKIILMSLVMLLTLSACIVESPPGNQPLPNDAQTVSGNVDYNPNPDFTSEEAVQVGKANNIFALDLYHQLAAEPGNLVYSPYSLYQALAMTYAGARGTTAEGMETALHLPVTGEALHPLMNGLNLSITREPQNIPEGNELFTLQIANAIWAAADQDFQQEFLDTLSGSYGAGLRLVDFNDPETAAALINAWVEAKTNGKIRDLAAPENFSANTALVLTNAVYFKAAWLVPFLEENTTPGDFTALDGSVTSIPMMHGNLPARAGTGEGWQVVELPYVGRKIVMDLIAPTGDDWAGFEEGLSLEQLDDMLAEVSEAAVTLTLPKFTIESEAMALNDNLANLGMAEAFSMQADFSGMTGDKSLYINSVVQKAFIDVNEAGTEAAAATMVVIEEKGVPMMIEMKFDRPFLYLIRDVETGTILFMGRFVQP